MPLKPPVPVPPPKPPSRVIAPHVQAALAKASQAKMPERASSPNRLPTPSHVRRALAPAQAKFPEPPALKERHPTLPARVIQRADEIKVTKVTGYMIWLPVSVDIKDNGIRIKTRSKGDVTKLVKDTLAAKDTVKEFENRYNSQEDSNPLSVKRFAYWTEYRIASGTTTAGPERLVLGEGGEIYYTGDHYTSLHKLEFHCQRETKDGDMTLKKWEKIEPSADILKFF